MMMRGPQRRSAESHTCAAKYVQYCATLGAGRGRRHRGLGSPLAHDLLIEVKAVRVEATLIVSECHRIGAGVLTLAARDEARREAELGEG